MSRSGVRIDRKLCIFLLVALTAIARASLLSADETPIPIRLLWVGSSSIYYHNQPKVCAQWLTEYCEAPALSELVGKSGTGVHVYLRPGFVAQYGLAPGQAILEKIAAEKYDYVVLQVPAEFINGPEGAAGIAASRDYEEITFDSLRVVGRAVCDTSVKRDQQSSNK